MYLLIIYLIKIYQFHCEDNSFSILTPQRPVLIQLTYPYFTGFQSMMHLGIRGGKYGFFEQYRINFFPERINFKSYKLMLYFNESVLNKNGYDRFAAIVLATDKVPDLPKDNQLLIKLWLKNQLFCDEFVKDLNPKDVMMSWDLFFLWFINGIYYFPVDRLSVPNMITNHDIMSGTYILLVCTQLRLKGLDNAICPDPCMRRPCANVPNSASKQCFRMKLGLFINDYSCKCKYGFKWHLISRRCLPFDLCSLPTSCDKRGTIRCVFIPGKSGIVCECKAGYMGPKCSLVRDPCIETSSAEKMSGNMYCNTGQGNTCKGTIGTDRFECICGPSWTQDWSLTGAGGDSNCLAFRDLCSAKICQSGDCISSKDGQLTQCICPKEFTGHDCSIRRSIWGRWMPWSSCDPVCGPVRRSVRVRFCNGENCAGERRQLRLCQPTYCGSHPMFEYASARRWKNVYYQMFGFVFLMGLLNIYICFVATIMLFIVILPGFLERIISFLPRD